MKRRKIASLDVGTSKICTIMADTDGADLRILGVGISPSRGLQKGLVVNLDDAKESIRRSIQIAEQAAGYRLESAVVSITGRHINSVNNRGVVSITSNRQLVRQDDVDRVLDVAQNAVQASGDAPILHLIPQYYVVDGQEGIKNPVGMHGFRLDVETHIITAASNSIQNLVKCVRGVGIDIDDMVLEPLASSEAVLTEDERQVGVVIADIGGGTTDICVFKEGSIYHTAILPVAGYQLTRDVAIGLGLPFEVAEEMKKRYGTVMPIYESNLSQQGSPISEDGHGVSYQDLCDILRARVEEILRLILLELPGSDYEAVIPAGLVLTGGSSNISGIENLGCDILKLPVRVGCPLHITGITDALRDPAYATGVGLLLWGAQNGVRRTTEWTGGGFSSRLKGLAGKLAGFFRAG